MSAAVQHPTEIDSFLFDLRGYLLLKNALTAQGSCRLQRRD